MCLMKLEDDENSIDIVIFPKMWQEMKDIIEAGKPYVVEGRLDDKGQFLPDKIVPAEGIDMRAQKYVKIVVNAEIHKDLDMKGFVIALAHCRGKSRLLLELHDHNDIMLMCLGKYSVEPTALRKAITGILPEGMYEIFAA